MRKHPLLFTVALVAVIAPAALGDTPITPEDALPPVTFRARNKFTQKTSRLLKIHVDADAMPLDSSTLTTLVNSGVVAGRAAEEIFGLAEARYGNYVEIDVKASKGGRSITARLDMTFRADQRIPERYFDKFVEKVRDHLRAGIADTVRLDAEQLALVKAQLMTRREQVEEELTQARTSRIEMTVKAGLAEIGYSDARSLVAAYMKLKQEYEIDLAAKKARHAKMQEHIKKRGSLEEQNPMSDPIVQQLQNLVELNQKRLENLTNSKYATPEDISQAQAALIDATTRVAERIEAIEEKSPHRQLETLEYDIAELEAKVQYCTQTLDDSKLMARDMFVSEEDIKLIRETEVRLRSRLQKFDTDIANIEDTVDRLQFVTVSILGYTTNEPDKEE